MHAGILTTLFFAILVHNGLAQTNSTSPVELTFCDRGDIPCGPKCCEGVFLEGAKQTHYCADPTIGLCCDMDQHDSNGICCDVGQKNTGGICCDWNEINCGGQCCLKDLECRFVPDGRSVAGRAIPPQVRDLATGSADNTPTAIPFHVTPPRLPGNWECVILRPTASV
jgi:hypothetical protein